MANFEYVINRGTPPKLCFGTMSERKIIFSHKLVHNSDSLGSLNFQKVFKGSFLKASRFVKSKPKYESIFYEIPKTEIKPTINLFKQTGRDDSSKQIVPGFVLSFSTKFFFLIKSISVSEVTK